MNLLFSCLTLLLATCGALVGECYSDDAFVAAAQQQSQLTAVKLPPPPPPQQQPEVKIKYKTRPVFVTQTKRVPIYIPKPIIVRKLVSVPRVQKLTVIHEQLKPYDKRVVRTSYKAKPVPFEVVHYKRVPYIKTLPIKLPVLRKGRPPQPPVESQQASQSVEQQQQELLAAPAKGAD